MNWKYKALLQLVFSNIPCGERLNYLFQRFVMKSLPVNDTKFASIVTSAKEHIDIVNKYCNQPLKDVTFYEFGAGWDLIIPLAFFSYGIEHQVLVDIRNLLRCGLVNDTIKKFQQNATDWELPRRNDKFLPENTFLSSLEKYYGIKYLAPCDARNTGLKTGSVDVITSTNTLEHISTNDIRKILLECHRLLRNDGLMSLFIDYKDHYSYFDHSISAYNFLQYSDRTWKFFNPPLHYQNRLRHKDYIQLFHSTGFEIIEESHQDGTIEDIETIERLFIDKRFRAYSFSELVVKSSHFVLRKRNTNSSVYN